MVPQRHPAARRGDNGLLRAQSVCYSIRMKATTIKVDGELLLDLERAKPPRESLTTFVRTILKQEVQRRKMADAAERYVGFLAEHADERAWLEAWDRADLATAPKRARR